VLSNILLPLFIPEPESGPSILRTLGHSHVSQLDGNLANPSQKRSSLSLIGHLIVYDDACVTAGAGPAMRTLRWVSGPAWTGGAEKGYITCRPEDSIAGPAATPDRCPECQSTSQKTTTEAA
jgi:hypothetical protein